MFAGLLLVLALMLTGCADTWEPAPSSESKEETTTEVTTEEKTETTTEKETETTTEETETEEETEATTEEETETSAEEVKEELPRFFGLPMEEKLQTVNLKTLSDPESGLFDILTEKTWTGDEVLQMIEHYNFPEKQYLGDLPTDPAKKEEIVNNRNLSALPGEDPVTPSYAILTDNASVRAFPSDLPARDSLDPHAFDYLQESVLNYGEGVVILHESLDQEWVFVQGFNYNGWIRKEKAAVCDFQAFTDYLNPDDFLVVTATEIYFDDRDMRLGTILPLTEKTDEYWKIIKPERTPEGTLFLSELLIEPIDEWSEEHPGFLHEGFIPYSQESLTKFSYSLVGTPYGWGDENNDYDCSSLAGLCYRCYGIFLPRNTSWMKHFTGGGEGIIDLSGYDREAKLQLIRSLPGAVLVMPGHCMIYGGMAGSVQLPEYVVVHCSSGYYRNSAATDFVSCYSAVESDLMELHRGDGSLFIDSVNTLLYVE